MTPRYVGKTRIDGRPVYEVNGRLIATSPADHRHGLEWAIRRGVWVQDWVVVPHDPFMDRLNIKEQQ